VATDWRHRTGWWTTSPTGALTFPFSASSATPPYKVLYPPVPSHYSWTLQLLNTRPLRCLQTQENKHPMTQRNIHTAVITYKKTRNILSLSRSQVSVTKRSMDAARFRINAVFADSWGDLHRADW
jgi:hypothetical protein